MSTYSVVIVGASGAVGSCLVRELLASSRCVKITALGRRKVDIFDREPNAAKLEQHVIDFDKIDTEENRRLIAGHEVAFCTMGTGQPSKVPQDEVWKVDVTYGTSFAQLCKAADVKHISLLSGVMGNINSRFFLIRMKGQVEKNYEDLRFDRLSLYKPSLLVTKEIRYGMLDRFNQFFLPKLSFLFPRQYHEIAVWDLGRAMKINAENYVGKQSESGEPVVEHFTWRDFQRILDEDKNRQPEASSSS